MTEIIQSFKIVIRITDYIGIKINVPLDITQQILDRLYSERDELKPDEYYYQKVFKIILRKQFIYNLDTKLIKEFWINVRTTDDHKINGISVHLKDNNARLCDIRQLMITGDDFCIGFDSKLNIDPYTLYKQGELSIIYLLNQDSLVEKTPTIKCDIIDAKNAFTLHESDVHYFYKPTMISESVIDFKYRVLNPETMEYEDKIDCYKMTYNIPEDYEIPTNLNFKFTEYCFGNQWNLVWDGEKWSGKNVLGRSNGKIESSKQYLRVDKKYNDYGASGCYVRCKHDT